MGTETRTLTVVPSGYTGLTGMSISGSYPATNAYTDETSTTYCRFTVSQSTTGSVYFTFDTSDLPADATITSVTAKARARVSNTTRVSNTKCQLYTGTTAKGSNSTFATTSNPPTAITLTAGTWTRSELNDLRLFVGGTGSSSTSSRYIYFYGASVTITYTVTTYDVTVSNSTSATVTISNSTPAAGDTVTVTADTLTGITVTDNGNDVTSQFIQGVSGTESSVPASYTTGGSINGTNYQSTIGKGSDTANRSGNDYFSTSQGGSGSTYIDYHFDFSGIPEGATISSMSVTVKGHCESTSESREISRVQCYSGTTAKGSYVDMTDSTTDRVYTISNPGTWTRAELQDARIKHTIGVYGGLMSGATWTVTYELSGYVYTITNVSGNHALVFTSGGAQPELYVKVNGSWVQVQAAYKKVNGSWVQQSDLTTVFQQGVNYKQG